MKQFIKTVCTTILPLWFFIMGLMYYGIFIMGHKSSPVYVEYFKQGDVLYPDAVCSDTMIVNDASGLNKDMALIEQGIIEATDDQIDSVFHLYCSIK